MKKKNIVTMFVVMLFLSIIYLLNKPPQIIRIGSSEELKSNLKKPLNNVILKLYSGHYQLQPTAYTDSICGNCEKPKTPVHITFGAHISGNSFKITGPDDNSAVIHTNSGYGLFFENCNKAVIENLTITDGIRDSAAAASDAAIVVASSELTIRNNIIISNIGDSLQIARNVSGIMGICGKNDAKLKIVGNLIIRNSWDAIALYRNCTAQIKNNHIDGIDRAGGRTAGGGRGVAIGITWNSQAKITNNYVARYWKGIGLFVDAIGVVQNNIIEDMSTWGISLWDAGKGNPQGYISQNIVYDTGAMGAAITTSTKEDPGFFNDNIIVQTAQNPAYDSPDYYGYQCALALHSVPEDFLIQDNLLYSNRRATDDLDDFDVNEEEFQIKLNKKKEWIAKLKFIDKSEFGKEFINH